MTATQPTLPMRMKSLDVLVHKSGTLYMLLPPELSGGDEGCCCDDCKEIRAKGGSPPTWNCLAADASREHTWTVHMPRSVIRRGYETGDFVHPRRKRNRKS